MTAQAILAEIRRRLGDALANLDVSLPNYSNEFIFDYIVGAVDYLDVIGVTIEGTFTVDVAAETITPEPTKLEGLLIATKVVAEILEADLALKVKKGHLGIRFKTGLEEISTIEASKRLGEHSAKHTNEFNRLKTLALSSGTAGASRVQFESES